MKSQPLHVAAPNPTANITQTRFTCKFTCKIPYF